MITYRLALAAEAEALKALLWQHGQNEWNYLTEEGVHAEFELFSLGVASILVAEQEGEIIGFSVLIDGAYGPDYLSKYTNHKAMYFIGDVLVARQHGGKGIATALLKACIAQAKQAGGELVLIERHEENKASAGMMRKAGFHIIDTFHDPQKRSAGSQNSCILATEL
ncbi:GNAT family N-acetyltransferase [Pseudoalteromonas sp. OOF1S-7]|uniref:GNAT family N-acetyltransferase n=1 Tax=Pseudoalteromonas sp. OOF1S-7 TaxID=2917757 RepID=UPI001EF5EFF3|nr:GNAT family N-acetyltransferase [Pseudoalteromonas sp. OOF1S-7]MCG7536561.1 GNAT family N-acetyltransferase [Pseudoalteromonas sp. OOF1S-7]